MNIEGIIIATGFMLLVGSIVFMIISNIPRGLRLLAKGLLIFGGVMMILPVILNHYFPESNIHQIGRILSYMSFHLGIVTILYGKIFIGFKDVKYRNSKWKPVNNQPLFVYMIAYLISQIFAYGMNIDILKEVIITESSTRTSPFGVPFILSIMVGGLVYISTVKKREVS
ncbi:hypothetical protein [Isachenkonia alkalipeptolytica]|uniref:Uncharacterized protein n=1 Tax=Isachenkonia alkalipeptolytica TaxID=2565777 RepID=A0AA43XK67_9CLOT|nr:hypothetical protein [Isachenkonia alkalipeptolytica]NBG88232.1 hypothetical protein [Isachenkonia alkalipeptolytica]